MSSKAPRYSTLEDVIGNTPLVRLVRLPGAENLQDSQYHAGRSPI